MKELQAILPSPTLVIGLGEFAGNLLPQVQILFHQGDPRRSAMVGFFEAATEREEQFEVKLRRISGEAEQGPESLTSALHELRLHEKYLLLGIDGEQNLSLGMIVVIDLAEQGSETLYPLLDALFERMADEPGAYIYLLCKTATFEFDPARDQKRARLHLHLEKLEKVAEEAGCGLQTYLFDAWKEGSLEAKNEYEIGVLIQNFLLALLSGRLAQRLVHEYSLAASNQGKAYYHSAGATALVYDPSTLQEACAMRLGAEALDVEFLVGKIPDPKEIENATRSVADGIGSESDWAEQLCDGTPYRTRSDQSIGFDLHLVEIQFEGLPPQEWGDEIMGYAALFEKDPLARCHETLETNSVNLGKAVIAAFENQLNALPSHSSLYPGGIHTNLQVIQELARVIYQRIQTCLPVQNEEETAAILDDEYQSAIERLDEAISALPDPPRWIKRLPGRLYSHAKLLFDFLFLRREHAQLIELREEIVQTLENKYIFQFEQRLRRHLVDLCKQLISSLEKAQTDLNILQSKFQGLKDRFDGQSLLASRDSSPFRACLVTPDLMEWAYVLGTKNAAEIRDSLLEQGYLSDWRSVGDEHLYQKLVSACRDAFQLVNDLNAEEVLKRVEFADFSAALVSLSLGAVPALRPDFDRGGESVSYLSNYFLCADPRQSEIADILAASVRPWQAIPTGDPNMILFCRVRQMIRPSVLSSLTQSAKAAFESLSEEEQSQMQKMFDGDKP